MTRKRVVPYFVLTVAFAVVIAAVAVFRTILVDPTGAVRPNQILTTRALYSLAAVTEIRALSLNPISISAYTGRQVTLELPTGLRAAVAGIVADGYFETAAPDAYWPAGDDTRLNHEGSIVLSERAWSRWFGRSAEAIGALVRVNGAPMVVVGVAPAGFRGFDPLNVPDLFAHVSSVESWGVAPGNSDIRWLRLIARDDGVERAERIVTDGAGRLVQHAQGSDAIEWLPLGDAALASEGTKRVRVLASVLSVLVALIVLIALASYMLWLLAEAESRLPSLVLRLMLGGGRARIISSEVGKAMLHLAPTAAAGGIGAVWLLEGLTALSDVGGLAVPVRAAFSIGDLAVGVTTVAILAVGCWIPVVVLFVSTLSRSDLSSTFRGMQLREVGIGGLRGLVVGVQVAVAVTAVTLGVSAVSTLSWQTFRDMGYQTNETLVLLPRFRVASDEGERARLQATVAGVAGVRGIATVDVPPLWNVYFAQEVTAVGAEDTRQWASNFVSADYFDVVGLPLLAGRGFNAQSTEAVVSRALADELGGIEHVLGTLLAVQRPTGGPFEVVGVVADSPYENLMEGDRPILYLPRDEQWVGNAAMVVHVERPHVHRDVLAIVQQLASIDRFEVTTLEDRRQALLRVPRALTVATSVVAVVLVALAAISLWSLLRVVLRQQQDSLRVRLALGASPGEAGVPLLRSLLPVVIGGGLTGVAASVGLSNMDASVMVGTDRALASWVTAAITAVVALLLLRRMVSSLLASLSLGSLLRHE